MTLSSRFLAGDARHQHFAVASCVPVAGIENSASHVAGVTVDSQVSAVYFHNEYS